MLRWARRVECNDRGVVGVSRILTQTCRDGGNMFFQVAQQFHENAIGLSRDERKHKERITWVIGRVLSEYAAACAVRSWQVCRAIVKTQEIITAQL